MVTEKDLVEALKELLPPLDPSTVSFRAIQIDLATRFDITTDELKAKHRSFLKQTVADMIELCKGGANKENESGADENDSGEDYDEPVAVKRKVVAKRSRAIRDSDDEEDSGKENEEEEDEEDDHSEQEDEDSEEESKPKRRKTAPTKKKTPAVKTAKRKIPAPRNVADKLKDSDGIAALKELARVAGLMGPTVYAQLKKADSEEEQETILRDRLDEGGVQFSGSYPKKSDIMAAKKKKDKERELDGIDTSLIITSGRPRRGAAQAVSYAEKYEDEDYDLEKGEGYEEQGGNEEGDREEDDDDEESEAHGGSDASDESEAEF